MNARQKAQREQAIQNWLITKLSEWLAIEAATIYIQEPFANYGLSSVSAVTLAGDLEEWLGVELSPTLAYEYPTIESLARYLADETERVQSAVGPTS